MSNENNVQACVYRLNQGGYIFRYGLLNLASDGIETRHEIIARNVSEADSKEIVSNANKLYLTEYLDRMNKSYKNLVITRFGTRLEISFFSDKEKESHLEMIEKETSTDDYVELIATARVPDLEVCAAIAKAEGGQDGR